MTAIHAMRLRSPLIVLCVVASACGDDPAGNQVGVDASVADAVNAVDAAAFDAVAIDASQSRPPELLAGGPGDQHHPLVAMDAAGNTIAIWMTVDHIVASRFVPGTGWSEPTNIGGRVLDSSLQLAVAPSGEALVLWNADLRVWSNRYQPGVGWGTAELLDPAADRTEHGPRLAINASGEAIAIWGRRVATTGTDEHVWSKRYRPGVGWGPSIDLGAARPETVSWSAVAINDAGDVVAVWNHGFAAHRPFAAVHYTAAAGWSAPAVIPGPDFNATGVHVALDSAGNAIAVWRSLSRFVSSTRFVPATGWGAPTTLGSDETYAASNPRIAVDAAGRATVLWAQRGVKAAQFVPGSGWGPTVDVAVPPGAPSDAELAIDAHGKVTAVWSAPHDDGAFLGLAMRRFVPGAGWGETRWLDAATGHVVRPHVAVSPTGAAVAVWSQTVSFDPDEEDWDVWATAF